MHCIKSSSNQTLFNDANKLWLRFAAWRIYDFKIIYLLQYNRITICLSLVGFLSLSLNILYLVALLTNFFLFSFAHLEWHEYHLYVDALVHWQCNHFENRTMHNENSFVSGLVWFGSNGFSCIKTK